MEHHASPLATLLTQLLGLKQHLWPSFGTHPMSVLERYDHLLMSALAALIVLVFAFAVRRRMSLVPGGLQQIMEGLVGIVLGEAKSKLGHSYQKHVPFIGALTLFILVNNLIGLIPGIGTGNSNWNVPLGMAIIVFFYYNIAGLKAQGGHYVAHFFGPVWWLMPLIGPLEIMGLFIRIFSHSLRLFVNMGLEHIIGGVFFAIFPFLVPVPMMFMGLLVCLIQCYVFVVLTTVYLGGAVAVAEHH